MLFAASTMFSIHTKCARVYQLCGVYLFAQHLELALSLIDITLVLFYLIEHILLFSV